MVKNLPAKQETWVWSLGWEDPLEKGMATTPVFLPKEFHGQRILVGYRELDTTGQLTHILILNRVDDNTKGKLHAIHTIERDVWLFHVWWVILWNESSFVLCVSPLSSSHTCYHHVFILLWTQRLSKHCLWLLSDPETLPGSLWGQICSQFCFFHSVDIFSDSTEIKVDKLLTFQHKSRQQHQLH